ncbi:MAG: inositol monophosphatase [Rhodobacteraceae bacterium]|nr:inositol monophosphatase [Paracoccaceae bacterium]
MLVAALRDAAAAEIMPRFRALAAEDIDTKSGPTDLVTLADIRAEAQITTQIEQLWPEAAVYGEEAVAGDARLRAKMGGAAGGTGPVVIIDPVDGTWNFAKGLSLFGVLLAVARGGVPEYGLLYDPVIDDWIEASLGAPSQMITAAGAIKPVHTSKVSAPRAMTGYVPLSLYRRAGWPKMMETFREFGRVHSLRCSCHEYRMLAQGQVEFILSGPVPHPWDHAAGALAVEGAGGVVRFLDGASYDTGRINGVLLAAGSQAAWDLVAERFAYLAQD